MAGGGGVIARRFWSKARWEPQEKKRGDELWLLWGGVCSGPVNNQLTTNLGHGLRHPQAQNLRDNHP